YLEAYHRTFIGSLPWQSVQGDIVMTPPAEDSAPAQRPIEAFIYHAGFSAALPAGKAIQRRYFDASQRWVPLIRVEFARSYDDRSTFAFRAEDQDVPQP
ncbi:MAG: hypothetical protein ABWZ85_00535, partial [Luteibacter sp.]